MDTSRVVRTLFSALGLLGAASAQAEWRCDCSTIVDSCSATVKVEHDFVAIESDHLQCARVDYLIDGLPFVALVVDGRETQSWLNRSENPRVLMQSCRVCLDNSAAPMPFGAGDARAAEAESSTVDELSSLAEPAPAPELSRLLAVAPQYPPSAASRGVAGFVEVGFTVSALGLVENARVVSTDPPGVFEQAALTAISRWRYNASEGREAVALSHRFDFKPEQAVVAKPAPRSVTAETAIDALIARSAGLHEGPDTEAGAIEAPFLVRNHCIREQLTYDFGEMVEANLMNTCSEPLMVYSCAEGLGRYHDRWVCHSTETAKSILVRPGDRLAGNVAMIEVPEGVRTYTYAQDLFVARARNTAYWWLACGIEDSECRGSGRQWARSMDGKPADVDPQLWTELSVARSY